MNIEDMINKLHNLIKTSSCQLGLTEKEVFKSQFDMAQGCTLQLVGHNKFYTIAHENVRIMEELLPLSQETISNIHHVRHFGFNMLHSTKHGNYRSQTFTINESENFIIIGLHGDKLPFLTINISIKNDVIYVSVSLESSYRTSVSYPIKKYDDIDHTINFAVKAVIPILLTAAGFDSKTIESPDVIQFISKTPKELLYEQEIDQRFNYLSASDLVHAICNDLKLHTADVMLGVDVNQSFNNIYIPPNLTCMLSTAVEKIINIDGIKSKIDQLITLFVFISYLHNEPLKFSLTVKEIEKRDFFKKTSFDRSYYILNIGSFMIHIGHNIPKILSPNSYMDESKDTKLFSVIYEYSENEYAEYVTNDLDYIYNIVLNELRDKINSAIGNQSDVITSKDLEVYTMAII